MIRIAFRYFLYLLSSKHSRGHGIHSPFVFSFVRNVLLNDSNFAAPDNIIKWHKLQRKNQNKIAVETVGEKSLITRSGERKIAELVRNSSIREKYGKLLFRLARYYRPEFIIELGTGLGISTAYLSMANSESKLISIEASREKIAFAEKELADLGFNNIQFICEHFDTILPQLNIKGKKSLVFIDGNHNYEATLRYFRHFKEQMGEEGILVFDDIHWSGEMLKAWKEICADEEIGISIDLFFLGIVFFKKTKGSRHYKIKF